MDNENVNEGLFEHPQRREGDLIFRITEQAKVLQELRDMMVRHQEAHAQTDPAVLELVNILQGAKLLRQVLLAIAGIVGATWAFFAFIWDHIKFVR